MPSPTKNRKKQHDKDTNDLPALLPEPVYHERKYKTPELIYIFEYALNVDFSSIQAFRAEESSPEEKDLLLKLMLIKMHLQAPQPHPLDVDISDLPFQTLLDPRVSLNIAAEHIPYALSTLIKRGMMNWDFVDPNDKKLKEIHARFKEDFEQIYINARENEGQGSDVHVNVPHLLDPLSRFRNQALFYTVEMNLISLITELTVNGYVQEAKAIHLFIMVSKRIIAASHFDPQEQEKTIKMLAPALMQGLHLDMVLDIQVLRYISSMINLTMKHPVFDEAYDEQVYILYHQISIKCVELNIGIETNTHLASKDYQASFSKELDRHYRDILAKFFPGLSENIFEAGNFVTDILDLSDRVDIKFKIPLAELRDQAVLNFFVNAISRLCQFEMASRGQDVHNVIYNLGKIYDEDNAKAGREQLYAKVLRQLLGLPSIGADGDKLFDEVVIRCVLGGGADSHFKKPFSLDLYILSLTQTRRYCRQVQESMYEARYENEQLKLKIVDLEGRIDGYQAEYDRRLQKELRKAQEKMTKLSIEHEEESSAPSSPQSSPPTSRGIFHRHRREKPSISAEQASERPTFNRALSDGSLLKRNKPGKTSSPQ